MKTNTWICLPLVAGAFFITGALPGCILSVPEEDWLPEPDRDGSLRDPSEPAAGPTSSCLPPLGQYQLVTMPRSGDCPAEPSRVVSWSAQFVWDRGCASEHEFDPSTCAITIKVGCSTTHSYESITGRFAQHAGSSNFMGSVRIIHAGWDRSCSSEQDAILTKFD